MPDSPETPPENIAPLLRLGLDEEQETQMADPNATIMVPVPTPRTGGSPSMSSRGWEPPSVEQLQQMLPQYEISAFIARGGMGAVYKGLQKTLKRPVAIKVLPPDLEDGDLQFAARFKHEAQAMAQLSHPHIVAVFDAGETPDGLLYFVMEFIEGTDVAQLIASEGQLDPLRAIQITTAVCEALAFAHEEGIIHRDIKPSNIMLDKKGRVKVADFGLAKTVNLEHSLQTQSNMALGTPDFIAPEALMPGMKLDGRADLYAVGVMLYQMLTGTIPRGRFELPSGVVAKVDKGFDAVVDKAMQTDREKRYSTAVEMKTAVERVSQGSANDGGAGIRSAASQPARSVSSGGKAAENVEAGKSARSPLSTVKSRTPLLIAAAVVVIGAGAFFAFKQSGTPKTADGSNSPSPGLPVPASNASRSDSGRSQSSSATELWINALTDAAKLVHSQTEVTSEGLRFVGNRVIQNERAPKRDGALRMQTGFVPGTQGPQLRVRNAAYDTQSYSLNIDPDGRAAVLRRLAKAAGGAGKLGEFPLPKPLSVGEDYELELRAVGSQFTVKFNGQALGEAQDAAIAEGKFGIASASTAPVLVKALEYLNLDGRAASPKPPSPTGALGQSALPQWRKAITRFEDVPAVERAKGTLRWQDGWLEPTSTTQSTSIVILPGPKVSNGGIRVRGRWSPDIQIPTLGNVFLRRTPGADTTNQVYRANVIGPPPSNVGLTLANDKTKAQEELARLPLQRTLIPGDEYELELIAIGDQLHMRLNDERLPVVTDTRLKEGAMGLHCIHPMRDVEVINLDGLSEAEARKAAGLEGRADGPPSAAVPSKTALGEPSALPPPGQWTKVLTKTEELDPTSPFKKQVRFQEGWLDCTGINPVPTLVVPGFIPKDCGLRLRGKIGPAITMPVGMAIQLRRTLRDGKAHEAYQFNLGGLDSPKANVGVSLLNIQSKVIERLGQLPPFATLKPGEEFTLEFYAIGNQLHARYNGQTLPVMMDARLSGSGGVAIQTPHLIRDVEVINLDGLSEAEARKAAGIEGRADGPSSAAVRPQSGALGQSALPAYPQPKQWVDSTEIMRTTYVTNGALRADGAWLEAQKEAFIGIGAEGHALQHLAVRVRFAHQVEVHLRKRAQSLDTYYTLRIGDRKASISLIQGTSRWIPLAAPVELKSDFDDGSEHELVATALGSQLSLWLDGTLLVSATDSTLTGSDLHQIRIKPKADGPPTRIKQVEYGALEAVSPSPSLPLSKSPAPTWRKVLTKPEDLPEPIRSAGQLQWKEGWISPTGASSPGVNIPGLYGKNRGIRLHGRVTTSTNYSICHIWVRKEKVVGAANDSYRLGLHGTPAFVSLDYWDEASKNPEAFHNLRPDPPLAPGAEYDLELYAIGDQLIARYNGQLLPIATDKRLTEGEVGLQIHHEARDVEVINLDGLSEAEARKVAGIGE